MCVVLVLGDVNVSGTELLLGLVVVLVLFEVHVYM